MKVAVTGGCGFLGSHICERYKKQGDDVVSIDNLTKHELNRTAYDVQGARLHNWDVLQRLGVALVQCDITNRNDLFGAVKDCDYLVHTAAQPAMTVSIENPELDFSTNVIGTFNVLECARRCDIPMVNSSSIHVYGNRINEELKEEETRFTRQPLTIGEDSPTMEGKITPLHASKKATEVYVQSYIDTYGLEAANYRLTGMYGPRQFGGEDHGWVANFAIRTLLRLPIKVFGTPKQVRDILYVSDAAEAFEAFYRRRRPGVYNIGGGPENMISIGECLRLISEITDIKQEISSQPRRLGDLWYFVCDIDKARSELGWQPKIPNREGVSRLVDWIRENIGVFRAPS